MTAHGETSGTWERVGDTRDILGESAFWSVAEQALYWVDIRGQFIRRRGWRDGNVQSWTMPELVGCIAPRSRKPGLIVALRSAIAFFDPATGTLERIDAPHAAAPEMRFNDGRCDRQGRFWVGSMDDVGRGPVGALYRFDGARLTRVIEGVAVPNSLCWSPDGGTLYFADGNEPVIWSFPFDKATGEPGDRRLFARLPDGAGIPDGATVDKHGFLWSAQYGGSVVTRYAPDGSIERVLPVPVTQPACCCFGGPDMRTLFVTTATRRLSAEALERQPLAGALLSLHTDIEGYPDSPFDG
ncbi:SMP-30/gluconolactonase/LRE family protein [Caballeronia sp. DA-9]|uniref:SMP-30/gluconolactonase/LRE family protein n=1 Tax=Caballeronia sp. DA-9 TaxID=3436237 RepID=UPI003F673934